MTSKVVFFLVCVFHQRVRIWNGERKGNWEMRRKNRKKKMKWRPCGVLWWWCYCPLLRRVSIRDFCLWWNCLEPTFWLPTSINRKVTANYSLTSSFDFLVFFSPHPTERKSSSTLFAGRRNSRLSAKCRPTHPQASWSLAFYGYPSAR
jgi:hypothetical protein